MFIDNATGKPLILLKDGWKKRPNAPGEVQFSEFFTAWGCDVAGEAQRFRRGKRPIRIGTVTIMRQMAEMIGKPQGSISSVFSAGWVDLRRLRDLTSVRVRGRLGFLATDRSCTASKIEKQHSAGDWQPAVS